jgi:HPt (histidine-containing phosphotransfer) domain-containing protein
VSRKDNRKTVQVPGNADNPAVLDREHLARYTMQNPELEREIIGLFLTQLPSVLDMVRTSRDQAKWKLATHTLKGSAVAVGAARIAEVARQLEDMAASGSEPLRRKLLARLDREVADFRDIAERLYR